VLYPAARFTKGQVIDYYIRVADALLPHLAGRPVTLKRFPDGVRGEFFYEKDAPRFTPDWVATAPVPRRGDGGTIRYIVVNDRPALVWLANLAALELHPFLHRVAALDRPTGVVFDLDPGEGADVLTCGRVALLLRGLLADLGLEALVKVSGAKGLHVHVPLNTGVTYDVTGPFARAVARLLEDRHGDLVVSEMPKHLRAGKVFIDWSQNADFKTTVSVYSLRAAPDRPFVSMPVAWDELEAAVTAGSARGLVFTPDAAVERLLAGRGDLFRPALDLRQELPRDAAGNPGSRRRPAGALPHRPALRSLPDAPLPFVEPMLARPVDRLPEGPGWTYEVKLDGYRVLAARWNGEAGLFSRRGHRMDAQFPAIAAALRRLAPDTLVDGEVVALDEEGRPSFTALQHWQAPVGPIVFYAFDLVAYQGKDLRGLPLVERRRLLETHAMVGLEEPVRLSPAFDTAARELLAAVRQQGLEGIVAKRRESLYESGKRTGAWAKYRTSRGQELVIGGYMPGPHGFDAILPGYYEGERLLFVGKVRNGFVPALRRELAERFRGLETPVCPFANLPEPRSARRGEALTREVMKTCRWLRPELVAQIEFTEWTRGDHLRHARFAGLRDDRDPRTVVREVASSPADGDRAGPRSAPRGRRTGR
jgi:bifunctional non-homologous end joining protein LigD